MSESTVRITVNKGASAKIEADIIEVTLPDGTVEQKNGKAFLCRCSESKNQPFCDGSHKECEFDA